MTIRALMIDGPSLTDIVVTPDRLVDRAPVAGEDPAVIAGCSRVLGEPDVEFDTRPDGFCVVYAEQRVARRAAVPNVAMSLMARLWFGPGDHPVLYGPAIVLGSAHGDELDPAVTMWMHDCLEWSTTLLAAVAPGVVAGPDGADRRSSAPGPRVPVAL